MTCETPKKIEIERYHVGELKGSAKSNFEMHLGSCSCCQVYFDSLEQDKKTFLFKHSYQTLNVKRQNKTSQGFSVSAKFWKPALVPVLLLLISVVIYLPQLFEKTSEKNAVQRGEIIYKSKTKIELVLRRGENVMDWTASDIYHKWDELQIVYTLSDPKLIHILLVSIDAGGVFSNYHETDDGMPISWRAIPGIKQSLPVSFTLDETPGFELVVVLFSQKPLENTLLSKNFKQMFSEAAGVGNVLAKLIESKYSGKTVLTKTFLIPK